MNLIPSGYQSRSLVVGSRVFSEAELNRFESGTTGIMLYSTILTAGRGTNLRTSAGTDYQVPVGKTLTIVAVITNTSGTSTSASAGTNIGYSDSAVAIDSASPGVNPVYIGGSGSIKVAPTSGLAPQPGQGSHIYVTIPAQKYPFMVADQGGTSCVVYAFIN
jgi:hypothetical protein